jgi:hypothetical protein
MMMTMTTTTAMMKTRHLILLLLASLLASGSSGSIEQQHHHHQQQQQQDRILQSSNPRVLGEIYECDELFQEVVDINPRPIGYEIRICILPDRRTRQRDVVMRSIDEFTFYKNFGSAVQKVVDKGKENEEQLSIVLCVPGQLICSFKARLKNEFFYDDDAGNITGSGTLSFQFSEDYQPNRRVLVQQQVRLGLGGAGRGRGRGRGRSMIEDVEGGFAGTDTVTVNIPVEGVPRPPGDPLSAEENAKGWWQTSPTWLKVLVVFGTLVTAILLCCLCGLCVYSLRSRIDDEKKEDEEKREREMENEDNDDNNDNDIDNNIDNANDDYGDEYYDDPTNVEDASQAETAPANNYEEGEQPGDFDVCFDADDHPGTVELHNVMRNTMQDFPADTEYGPSVYRHIKQQLPGRRYFLVDDENRPDFWRETGKKELIDLFRKEFEDLQQQMR